MKKIMCIILLLFPLSLQVDRQAVDYGSLVGLLNKKPKKAEKYFKNNFKVIAGPQLLDDGILKITDFVLNLYDTECTAEIKENDSRVCMIVFTFSELKDQNAYKVLYQKILDDLGKVYGEKPIRESYRYFDYHWYPNMSSYIRLKMELDERRLASRLIKRVILMIDEKK